MTCPSCGQSASNFHRFVFTIQGVTIRQSIKGFLRCQNCQTLLRLAAYNRFVWLQIVLAVTAVALYTAFGQQIVALVGFKTAQIGLVPFLLLVGYAGTYVFWRGAHAEKAVEVHSPA